MKTAPLILLVAVDLLATQEGVLSADRIGDMLVLNQVYINNEGPFRMMIDTGATSSAVCEKTATCLGLRPVYAVRLETASGAKRVAATVLDEVQIGPVRDNAVEAMIMDPHLRGIDGVLGQSWLVRHDYLLDYRHQRLVVDMADAPPGVRTELRSTDGRPLVALEVDGRRQELVVDSGTSVLVLFRRTPSVRLTRLVTDLGPVGARIGTAGVRIGGSFNRLLKAAEIDAPPQSGLLPTAAFQSVYISNRNGVVVFVP